jgi:hypothetical protein
MSNPKARLGTCTIELKLYKLGALVNARDELEWHLNVTKRLSFCCDRNDGSWHVHSFNQGGVFFMVHHSNLLKQIMHFLLIFCQVYTVESTKQVRNHSS